MADWLFDTTRRAFDRLIAHAALVDLPNTDEFTFRSFFMAALREAHPDARMETEWKWFDLFVQLDDCNALIEFKYFMLRRHMPLSGRGQWKGGAGVQNEREFWECVQKLNGCPHEPIHRRALILVYQRLPADGLRKTFDASYGSLAPSHTIASVEHLESEHLICKLLTVGGEPCSPGGVVDRPGGAM